MAITSPVVLAYIDSMIGVLRAGGYSADLTYHALHTVGSRLIGFAEEVFNDTPSVDPATQFEFALDLLPDGLESLGRLSLVRARATSRLPALSRVGNKNQLALHLGTLHLLMGSRRIL